MRVIWQLNWEEEDQGFLLWLLVGEQLTQGNGGSSRTKIPCPVLDFKPIYLSFYTFVESKANNFVKPLDNTLPPFLTQSYFSSAVTEI